MRRMGITAACLFLVALAVAAFVFPFPWTTNAQPPMPETPRRDRFAEDRAPPEIKAVSFKSDRAMEYLVELCKIGPRVSGSEGMEKQQKLLKEHFEKLGGKVTFQRFEGKQPSQRNPVPMANMIVTWHPDAKRRVIFCGHYDTRPIADQEPRRADWFKPFLSANDGTSTTAFLMEFAHHMKDISPKVGVDFVIFDGEEWIHDPDRDKFFLGSNHFAEMYKKEPVKHRYIAAVLLDLFASKDASYPVEQNSLMQAGELCESIWATAKELKVDAFRWEQGPDVLDDHIALNRVGIPAVDILDFSYKHWHRLSDLPDQCSAESFAQVAKVLTTWIQRIQ